MSPTAAEPVTPDVPSKRFGPAGGFEKAVSPEDLVHFVLNIGDGDTQLLLLPAEERRKGVSTRKAIVVDVVPYKKLEALIDALQERALLDTEGTPLELVVATHPHADHIKGMGGFLNARAEQIRAFMEPGFAMASASYHRMMEAIAAAGIDHTQPSGGTVRFIDQVKVTVLAPGISLKNRYDTYGVDPNNSSIVLKIEFPARRYYIPGKDGSFEKLPDGATLLLGGDAQTLSWSQVMIDNPQLAADDSPIAEALRKARGVEPLSADVFKVAHHGSKHGINLELVEEVSPAVSLISAVDGGGKYNFPHRVALEQLREGLEKTTSSGAPHSPDYELGIHLTAGREADQARRPLGTIAVVVSPSGRKHDVWRFGDRPDDDIDLDAGRPFKP